MPVTLGIATLSIDPDGQSVRGEDHPWSGFAASAKSRSLGPLSTVNWRGVALAVVVVPTLVTAVGCARTVSGTPHRVARPINVSAHGYGYTNDRCGMVMDITVEQLAGADNLIRTYSGAVCQFILTRQATVIDVNYSWFEAGTLDRERSVAQATNAQITDIEVERHKGFLARRSVTGSACSATAATNPGVASWWVQVRGNGRVEPGLDPCDVAQRLLGKTLSSGV